MDKKPSVDSKFPRKVIIIAVAVVVLVVASIGLWAMYQSNEQAKADEQARVKAQRAAELKKKAKSTEGLNLSVSKTATGLKLTNNENAKLTKCKVRLNSVPGGSYGYYTTVAEISPTPVVVPWSDFGKTAGFGTVRFDPKKEDVTKVNVGDCSEQPYRIAIYGN